MCPVERADSPCPDRPLADTEVRVLNERGDVVATTRTDRDGRFEIHLAPGSYTVVPVLDEPGPPSPIPVPVVVRPHRFAEITVPVDSGIR